MNKTYLAMTLLEVHMDEWEPIVVSNGFAIRARHDGEILGAAKSLKLAILKARDNSIQKLRLRGLRNGK